MLSEEEFKQEWVTAWVNSQSGDSAERIYWYGYMEALLARDFNHQFQVNDDAHKKWSELSKEIQSTVSFVADGYIDGLEGRREPRYRISDYPNYGPNEFNVTTGV